MAEQLPKEKQLAMECVALGCQRDAADKLIQELRAEKADLLAALTHAKQWLEGWASAEYELAYIEKAIQKATQS